MLQTRSVSNHIVEMVTRLADRGGVGLGELLRGLPLDEHKLRLRAERLDWEHFVTVLERLENRLGAERLDELCARLPDLAPSARRLFGAFVSPRLLLRFVNQLMGPSSYPMLEVHYDEREVGHLKLRLREGLTGSRTVFRVFKVAMAAIPTFIGHDAVPVRAEITERGGDYWLTLPPSEGVRSRLKRALPSTTWREVVASLEEDKRRFLEANELVWRSRETSFQQKLDEAGRRWSLTPRQLEVLAGLTRGLSNKALVEELGCSLKTIETHVTDLLRRSRAESRLALVATFWREL